MRIIAMIVDKDFEFWIKNDEGYSSKLYKDTAGKLTIGYGRNIEDEGIRPNEGELMFQNDLKEAINDIDDFLWYIYSPDPVKKALINMSYNLGLKRLLTFKKMLQAIIDKNYTKAAIEALDSKWAKQVGGRAKDIAVMIREAK
jgi:lysozyme